MLKLSAFLIKPPRLSSPIQPEEGKSIRRIARRASLQNSGKNAVEKLWNTPDGRREIFENRPQPLSFGQTKLPAAGRGERRGKTGLLKIQMKKEDPVRKDDSAP